MTSLYEFLRHCRQKEKNGKPGMEMVQVAILIGIAIVLGLIFREKITDYVNGIFGRLSDADL